MRKIIGVIGWIGSGKGTVGDYLSEDFGFQKISFADSLKDSVSAIFGWDRDMLEGATKESRDWREKIDPWWTEELGWEVTPRKILQLAGTEGGRHVLGENIWVASAMKKVYSNPDKNYVFTDVRFVNEIEAILKAGGELFVVRRGENPEWAQVALGTKMGTRKAGEQMADLYPDVHISEWDWIEWYHIKCDIDHVLLNDGTLDEFYNLIDKKVIKDHETFRKHTRSS